MLPQRLQPSPVVNLPSGVVNLQPGHDVEQTVTTSHDRANSDFTEGEMVRLVAPVPPVSENIVVGTRHILTEVDCVIDSREGRHVLPAGSWLATIFPKDAITEQERRDLFGGPDDMRGTTANATIRRGARSIRRRLLNEDIIDDYTRRLTNGLTGANFFHVDRGPSMSLVVADEGARGTLILVPKSEGAAYRVHSDGVLVSITDGLTVDGNGPIYPEKWSIGRHGSWELLEETGIVMAGAGLCGAVHAGSSGRRVIIR